MYLFMINIRYLSRYPLNRNDTGPFFQKVEKDQSKMEESGLTAPLITSIDECPYFSELLPGEWA